jgi:hypothetical protein
MLGPVSATDSRAEFSTVVETSPETVRSGVTQTEGEFSTSASFLSH